MSGHWYDKNGKRHDFVKGATGKNVKPDIRHARTYDLVPGVTTIIRCAASEPLVQYRERQVLMAALTLTREEGESDEAYCRRVMRDSREHAEKAADKGTDIHGRIEKEINRRGSEDPYVLAVGNLLWPIGGPWLTEHAAVSRWGYATKADLFLPPTVGITGYLVDLKTKDGRVDDLGTYDQHHMQLAATMFALGHIPGQFPCAILYVSRDVPGNAKLVPVEPDKLWEAMKMFLSLLIFWQVKNKHVPVWATEAVRLHKQASWW